MPFNSGTLNSGPLIGGAVALPVVLDAAVYVLQESGHILDASVYILSASQQSVSWANPTPQPQPVPLDPDPDAIYLPPAENYILLAGLRLRLWTGAASGAATPLTLSPYTPEGLSPEGLVQAFTWNKKRKEGNTWTVKLSDHRRLFPPRGNPSDSSIPPGCLKPDVYTTGRLINKYLTAEFRLPGSTTSQTLPRMIPLTFDYHGAPEGYEADMSGTDFSRPLYAENQSMSPWVSTSSHVYHASEIVAAILQMYKIPQFSLDFDDYPLRKFTFQGEKPIDAINRLLFVPQATWRFKQEGTFAAWQPRTQGVADHAFVDTDNCEVLDYKHSIAGHVNMLTVSRSQESQGLVAEVESTDVSGSLNTGFQVLKWTTPAKNLRVVVDCLGGTINYPGFPWAFYGPGGARVGETGPATEFHFTFVQKIYNATPGVGWIDAPVAAYYHIRIYGEPASTDDLVGAGLDDGWTVNLVNQASINLYGQLPDKEPVENPNLPNKAVATVHGERVLEERFRLLETIVLRTWLRPDIEPDETATVHCAWAGLTEADGLWQVESNAITWTPDGGESAIELS